MKKLIILLYLAMTSILTFANETILIERSGYKPNLPPTIDDVKDDNVKRKRLSPAKLVEKKIFGNTVKLTYRMKEDQINQSFQAGDFAKFYVPTINKKTGEIDSAYLTHPSSNPSWFNRTYSIASSEAEYYNGELIVYYAKVDDGYFNHYVEHAELGSTIYLAEPKGKLRGSHPPSKDKQCYITTGTGIAPVISKLLSADNTDNVEVYASFKKHNDIIGEDILREFNPNIKLNITLTQEKKAGYLYGRLQHHINDIDNENTVYYLIGGPDLVEDFEKRLSKAGATVRTEGYPLSGQKEYPYNIFDISPNDGQVHISPFEIDAQSEK
ncbi:MAG: FAD-dependent oxidoreductase [Cellvibrionales bacterium]|nr:FAD-dependent oxidoreductase [Cellvibrionales bacterium]